MPMTDIEIHRKIANIKLSDAPIDVREQAIKDLEMKLSNNSAIAIAKQQIKNSTPDYSDIGK
jgi:hypothetical protein